MKAPENWEKRSNKEKIEIARKLLVWNCNLTSKSEQSRHYLKEIKPIHDFIESEWREFWRKLNNGK